MAKDQVTLAQDTVSATSSFGSCAPYHVRAEPCPQERSTRSKAKSGPSRPDGDSVKNFLKNVEGWRYERKQGWWLKKAPDSVAYDLSDKQEMWTYVTEHCEVGVPCGSGSKGWPYVGPLEAGGAAIVCLDKGILPDNWGVIAPDQLVTFMARPGTRRVRDSFNNWQKNRERQAEYW